MGKRSDLEPAAIRLYAEGKEIPQISAELEVSENSLREWKRRAGPEWDEARAACRKGFVASFEEVGARLRRSREITDRISGDIKSQGDMGVIINGALRTMMFDILNQITTTDILDPDTMTATIDQMNRLALMLNRAEAAAERNRQTAAEIRKLVLEQAAKNVESSLRKSKGASDALIEQIRADILGVELPA